jgi:hypothetical protein
MTARQLAKRLCCNFRAGECVTSGRKCRVWAGKNDCRWFDETLAPLLEDEREGPSDAAEGTNSGGGGRDATKSED